MHRENLPRTANKDKLRGAASVCNSRHEAVLCSSKVLECPKDCHNKTSVTMFAPPPVQLSRAEVEARLEAKRRNAAAGPHARSVSTISDSKSASLHRQDSRSPTTPSKHHIFGKGSKISSPLVASPPVSPQPRKKSSSIFKFTAGEEVDSPDLVEGFGEHPRRAPEPPRRGTRPPSAWFERRLTSKDPTTHDSVQSRCELPPPIPAKSPRRLRQREREQTEECHSQSRAYTTLLNDAFSNLQVSDESQSMGRPLQPRSLSEPMVHVLNSPIQMARIGQDQASDERSSAFAFFKDPETASHSTLSANMLGRTSGRIDKPVSKRSNAGDSIREALLEYNALRTVNSEGLARRRATEGDIDMVSLNALPQAELPLKLRRKGEAIGLLLNPGCHSAMSLQNEKDCQKMNTLLPLPPPLSLLNKDLPATPTSIMATPTEMYHVIPPRTSRPVVQNRKARSKKRSPLAPISTTHAKANSNLREKEDLSPGRLSMIPEDATFSENSPVPSGLSTPVETQIHLRNGSVVTVSPPEFTAWKRSVYIQGPIKLPKPVVVPGKNSMASLEAFQEAIDQVYQDALNIPRRRSDDAVVDDVCEFFDDFQFDEVSFEGDVLAVEEILLDEISEEPIPDQEHFSTPPAELDPSPVEKVLAQEIVHVMSKPAPVPKPPIPPVENEETLRARGIARRAQRMTSQPHVSTIHNARKDSLTISKPGPAVLPILPALEEGMLEAVLEPSRAENNDNDVPMSDRAVDQSGFDWGDDVEELDGHTFWLAPRRRGKKSRHRKTPSTTPIQRMKELAFL